ncbi:hypothetical protein Micbo1qcDRAFT_219159 [Microdochium bolleyi]|uniref:Apple domain-containing protein n=1 Tax=Microdochium bolleyi TaxID=196109 RepID=A0A136INQ3_9PEZI|nr:hypothetical protein Micbo1qcDRAFT_219159 [Microdochium bolleyi]
MKFQDVLVLFGAVVSATAPPTCKGLTPSCCKNTSNRDAIECQRLFVKNHINVATCLRPAATVTSTRTNCETRTTTKTLAPPPRTTKVCTTITKSGNPTTPPTITVTATSTKTDTTISTGRTTTTEFRTITQIVTSRATSTQSLTTTITATTTVPFEDRVVCRRKKRAPTYVVPASCSCFLTTSKHAATKTAIITKTLPAATHTVYKTAGIPKVVTESVTITYYTGGPALSASKTTKTSITTITQTSHPLTTITEFQTKTATQTDDVTDTVSQTKTESAAAMATATASPCDGELFSFQQVFSSSSIEITSSSSADGPDAAKNCCLACFARTNCVAYRIGGGICDVYSSVPSFRALCTSPLCPRGFPNLNFEPRDGRTYYQGPCVGRIIA